MPTREEIIEAARTKVREQRLRVDYIDAKPEQFDWTTNAVDEDGDPLYDVFEAITCDDCNQPIVDSEDHGVVDSDGASVRLPDDVPLEDLDDWADEHGLARCPRQGSDARDLFAEGPMMNIRYPIADGTATQDNARDIVDLPLCLVSFEDADYLALTGGGMDLSWEICEAYVTLGFLPPTHFRLPRMADKYLNEGTALVVAAVEYANEIQAKWAASNREDAARLFGDLVERSGG